MPVTIGSKVVIASARDVGNYVAGYYASVNGFSWASSRIAFDLYQGGVEGIQTQSAQFAGWSRGSFSSRIYKNYNLARSVPSLYKFFIK